MSDVTNSCPLCNARGLSVREAFAKSGHPVPEGARIASILGTLGVLAGTMEYIGEQSCADWYEFKATETINGPVWAWTANGKRGMAKAIDLSNLPAQDAYDALPQVVRDAITPAGGER